MGISRQAWYQSLQRERRREIQAQDIIEQVTTIRLQQPRLGTRKLHDLLRQQAEPALHVGRDRLFQILRCSRLLVMPKRAYHKTTNSHHRFYRHPNLLKGGKIRLLPATRNRYGSRILRIFHCVRERRTSVWSLTPGREK